MRLCSPNQRQLWREFLYPNSVQIFIDDSKLNESLGFSKSIRLQNYCSICQTKVSTIQAVVEVIRDIYVLTANIAIVSDNQKAVTTLSSKILNSKTVFNFHKYLIELVERCGVRAIWVPGTWRDMFRTRHCIMSSNI